MATLDKAGGRTMNTAFTSAADQRIQYREAFWNWLQTFYSANWTLTMSSNGVTANASDNLPAATSVLIGLNSSEPISYFVVRSPDGWVQGGNVYVLVATNNATADTTPQDIIYRISTGPYTLAVALPTRNVPTPDTTNQIDYTGRQMIPWTAVVSGRWSSWWTDDGDVQFAVKQTGTTTPFRLFTSLTAPGGLANGAEGPEFACSIFHFNVGVGSNALVTSINTIGNGFFRDGTITGLQGYSVAGSMVNWTLGLDENGQLGAWYMEAFANSGAGGIDSRYLGYMPNIRACPDATAFNNYDSGDGDAVVYVALGAWMLPTTVASWSAPTVPFA